MPGSIADVTSGQAAPVTKGGTDPEEPLVAPGVRAAPPTTCAFAQKVALLIMRAQIAGERIAVKLPHLAIARHYPVDLLRHAEALESLAVELRVLARQIARRALKEE